MLRARFSGITKWLIRSRRFRHGHLLVVMLAAVSSAEAPIEFMDRSPAASSAEPTAPIAYNTSAKASLPTSSFDDPPWPAPDMFVDSVGAESPNQPLAEARVLAQQDLSALDFPFQHLIDQQTNGGETTPPQVDPNPAPAPAIDLSTSGDGGSAGIGNDSSFGGDGGTTSTPAEPVISTPGTTVPDPEGVWLISVSLLGICRFRRPQ